MSVTNRNISKVVGILKDSVKELPDPAVTLVGKKWKSPYLVLISCLLSLRTKDGVTLLASHRLFQKAKTPKEMLNLSEAQIRKVIYPVGFYKTKARNILAISQRLEEEFRGQVPADLDVLLTFKGVGRKTANLVLNEGFAKEGICVDTHVHRISNRMGYVETRNPHETEQVLRKNLPKRHWIEYNTLLVLWGQNVCRPVSPFCSQCTIKKYCAQAGVVKKR